MHVDTGAGIHNDPEFTLAGPVSFEYGAKGLGCYTRACRAQHQSDSLPKNVAIKQSKGQQNINSCEINVRYSINAQITITFTDVNGVSVVRYVTQTLTFVLLPFPLGREPLSENKHK